jgi:hypothetical protein
MDEPGFDNYRRRREREMHDPSHGLEHALRQMEHNMKHAERERMHAIKDVFKSNIAQAAAGRPAATGPRTVEEVLVEIDSYLSYLEDMPKEKLVPHESKIDGIAGHMEKVRSSLKKKI